MATDLTLSKNQKKMLSFVPSDWSIMAPSPNNIHVKALERRGLIEVRLNPEASRTDSLLRAKLGWQLDWEWRRKPAECSASS